MASIRPDEPARPPSVDVPEQLRPGAVRLASLADATFEALLGVCGKEKPTLSRQSLVGAVTREVAPLTPEEVKPLIDAAIGLATGQLSLGLGVDDFAQRISQSTSLDLPEQESRRKLGERLAHLLRSDSISISAKAIDLIGESSHVFLGVRIVTDIRPVFREDQEATPVAVFKLHTLKLSHLQGGRFADFFVTLDPTDLDVLSEAIDRARRKANSVDALVGNTAMINLDLTRREDSE